MYQRTAVVAVVCAIGVLFGGLAMGCQSSPETSSPPKKEIEPCEDDCVQPPLRRAELVDHLLEHQDRILSREDYRDRRPPPVSDIIYGPVLDDPLHEGPPVENADGDVYDGELNWHLVDFEGVKTDGVEYRTFRGRTASGAHCFFARKPNRHTSIFAVLVLHHRDRGDVLYFGGPHQQLTRIDTVPITDHHPSRLQVADEPMRCVFRHDQNRMGAIVVPFEYADVGPPANGPHYAVFTITVDTEKKDTGETKTVRRTTGLRGDEVVELDVPIRRYLRPRIETVGSYTTVYDALRAAEEEIVAGDFRLRPEFVYPRMPWQSYLDSGEEEFCPNNVDCWTPSLHLNKDELPPME